MKPAVIKHITALAYILLVFFLVNAAFQKGITRHAEVSTNSQICLETCQIQQRQVESYVTQEMGLPKATIEDKAHTLAHCHSKCLRNILATQDSTGY